MQNKNGFTLLEILLVVALIAILAGIIIVAINPSKQLADGRNTQRAADVNTIINAVYQYAIDNNGAMPTSIPTSSTCPGTGLSEICKKDAACSNLVDLETTLLASSKYLVSIPFDPRYSTDNGTGYFIVRTSDNRIIVCATHAENNVTINISK